MFQFIKLVIVALEKIFYDLDNLNNDYWPKKENMEFSL